MAIFNNRSTHTSVRSKHRPRPIQPTEEVTPSRKGVAVAVVAGAANPKSVLILRTSNCSFSSVSYSREIYFYFPITNVTKLLLI